MIRQNAFLVTSFVPNLLRCMTLYICTSQLVVDAYFDDLFKKNKTSSFPIQRYARSKTNKTSQDAPAHARF